MPTDKAEQIAGSDPDYNNRKLFNAIASGDPVSCMEGQREGTNIKYFGMSCFADLSYFLLHGLEGLWLSLKVNHPWQIFSVKKIL